MAGYTMPAPTLDLTISVRGDLLCVHSNFVVYRLEVSDWPAFGTAPVLVR